jgi:hypothetical protein
MRDVLAAADLLRSLPTDAQGDDDTFGRLQRVVETGMFVIYARPFIDSRHGAGALKRARGLSDELRQMHQEILEFSIA